MFGQVMIDEDMVISGAAQQKGSILASDPVAPGSILGIPKNFSLAIAKIY